MCQRNVVMESLRDVTHHGGNVHGILCLGMVTPCTLKELPSIPSVWRPRRRSQLLVAWKRLEEWGSCDAWVGSACLCATVVRFFGNCSYALSVTLMTKHYQPVLTIIINDSEWLGNCSAETESLVCKHFLLHFSGLKRSVVQCVRNLE